MRSARLSSRNTAWSLARQLRRLGVTPSMIEGGSRRGAARAAPSAASTPLGHRQLRREGPLARGGPGGGARGGAEPPRGGGAARAAAVEPLAHRRDDDAARPAGQPRHRDPSRRRARRPRTSPTVDGIPVTTVEPARLVDLADVVPKDQPREGPPRGRAPPRRRPPGLRDAMQRTRTRKGAGHATPPRRPRGAPPPRHAAHPLGPRGPLPARSATPTACRGRGPTSTSTGHEVDACWPARRLAVELDGWARHKDRHAFQRDRTKGNALTSRPAGGVLRFTHDDVVRRPAATAAADPRVPRGRVAFARWTSTPGFPAPPR